LSAIREDFREILRLVRPGARVLDVGCEDGELLELLSRERRVDGQGLEISQAGVSACLARGLAVVQGDGDRDLDHFRHGPFDYAILSKTLQQMREPRHVLSELLRIADQAIVSVPNFGHWRMRASLMTPRPHAGDPRAPRPLVVDAEHPPLHPARLHRPLPRARPAGRCLRGAFGRQAGAADQAGRPPGELAVGIGALPAQPPRGRPGRRCAEDLFGEVVLPQPEGVAPKRRTRAKT
jgi:SAM-dependent methyltransferase